MAGGALFEHDRVRRHWVDFRLGYQPSFDGLRGIGVTTFILYHCIIAFEHENQSWFLPGAYLWLELFFVQSGFLITSLLLDEWYRTGEMRLRNFYARRALRLLPALLAVVLFTVIALLTFSPYGEKRGAWQEVWGALLYYQNWLGAFGTTRFPFYLSHVWSLSIEEQFYLVAPIGIVVLLAWQRSLRRAIPFIVVGVLASVVWMGVMASHTYHPLHLQRLYYGTDTRLQALLVGVVLAFAVHSGLWLRSGPRHDRIAKVWGLVGFTVLVVMLFTANLRTTGWYYGGFLLCSVSVAGILSELIRHPDGRLARFLAWKPFQLTGEMTYGLYLWHWPTIMVVDQYTDWPEFPTIALQVVVSFVVATISYRYLERPILDRWAPRFPRATPERIAAHRQRMAEVDAGSADGAATPLPTPSPPPAAGVAAEAAPQVEVGDRDGDGDARPAPSATPVA
jgi:peptidoglycan/LPS O-acetylase OafA/YrhL